MEKTVSIAVIIALLSVLLIGIGSLSVSAATAVQKR